MIKMKSVRTAYRNLSLWRKLIFAFTAAITLVFLLNLFLFGRISGNLSSMEQAYQGNVTIFELQESIKQMHQNLYSYLNGNYDSLKGYYSDYSKVERQIAVLNVKPTSDPTGLLEKDINGLVNSYLRLAEAAVSSHRGTDLEQYTVYYEDATVIYQYIEDNLYALNNATFADNTRRYMQLSQVQNYTQKMNLALLLLASLIEILVIMLVINQLVAPLSELAERANLVGRGQLDEPPLQVHSQDEVGQVSEAFNKMTVRLRDYIALRQEQLQEENRLKQEQLQLETYLKDSQLGALQAQINPHFLYNTMNAGAQLALMEDAEKTNIFLERVADYYRYNLKRSGKDVTLEEEVSQVENYVFIMNTRFTGAIQYQKNLPAKLPKVRLPGMILQPIVENAIEHGLRVLEGEQHLLLCVYEEPDRVVVSVEDNGPGFPKEKAEALLSNKERTLQTGDGKHGIGMANVISRLRLYYDRDDVIEIGTREDGTGTEIRVLIPLEGE